MPTCRRCHQLTATTAYAGGLLHLCAACTLQPQSCGEFQHEYYGAQEGKWVCLRCATVLTSVPISTDGVQAPQAPPIDWYC